MSVRHFGWMPDGTQVLEASLSSDAGARCHVITYGGAVRDLLVPLADDHLRRVVLGFQTLDGYLADRNYIGVTVGRTASRIRRGRIRVDGRDYQLALNDRGRVHLHGGTVGFGARPWRLLAAEADSVMLGLTSPAGDQGYPGALDAQCLYRLEADTTLRVIMTATTDAPTVINLAHHSYFNLLPGSSVRQHTLQVRAASLLRLDDEMLPTGELRPVADTSADFRMTRLIGETDEGFDMAFVLDEPRKDAATLWSPDRNIRMTVETSEPCLVFYDGGHMVPGGAGYHGAPYRPHDGLCLEPMRFLDGPNQPAFPSWELRPGTVYRQETLYRFDTMPQEGMLPTH